MIMNDGQHCIDVVCRYYIRPVLVNAAPEGPDPGSQKSHKCYSIPTDLRHRASVAKRAPPRLGSAGAAAGCRLQAIGTHRWTKWTSGLKEPHLKHVMA